MLSASSVLCRSYPLLAEVIAEGMKQADDTIPSSLLSRLCSVVEESLLFSALELLDDVAKKESGPRAAKIAKLRAADSKRVLFQTGSDLKPSATCRHLLAVELALYINIIEEKELSEEQWIEILADSL